MENRIAREQSLNSAYEALNVAKAHIEETGNADAQENVSQEHASSLKEQLAAIKKLATDMESMIGGLVPQAPVEVEATEVKQEQESAAPSDIENIDPQAPNPEGISNKEKLVEVPVRKRTGHRAEPGCEPTLPRNTFTLSLPGTPFAPLAPGQPQPLVAGNPNPVQNLPTTTPVAANILTSLGLGGGAPQSGPSVEAATQNTGFMYQNMGMFQGTYRDLHLANQFMPMSASEGMLADRKPCNCKRSACLKLYCDCFAAGGFCTPGCSCENCCNTEQDLATVRQARKLILSKDPLAFHTKVSAGAGHKKGCKCKRSKCLKKYCECFNAGAKCNPDVCSCEGCRNCERSSGPYRDNSAANAIESGPYGAMYGGMAAPYLTPGQAGMFLPPGSVSFDQALAALAHAPQPDMQQYQQQYQQQQYYQVGPDGQPLTDSPVSQGDSEPVSALVSHLSDIPGAGGEEVNDTAASPAPHAAAARAAKFMASKAATMTAGRGPHPAAQGPKAVHPSMRPPLPQLARTMAAAAAVARPSSSLGALDESQRSKRPRRAASGGIQGAVAAEAAADWGPEFISPPLKRVTLPAVAAPAAGEEATPNRTAKRNVQLRQALQGVTPVKGPEENEAASALVDLIASFC